MKKIAIYDTTLRDGMQGEGLSISCGGKLRLAAKFDEFGLDYVEGGFAGSNLKDMDFFREVRKLGLKNTRIAAFGSTRRAGVSAAEDMVTRKILETQASVATIFGKAWRLHVRDVLRTTDAENLAMVRDTVRTLKQAGREVIFDAEHFFDGYKDSPAYALKVLAEAARAGADCVVLCDTNGGCLPHEVHAITRAAVRAMGRLPVGIHCHNDGGMGVANSIEAVRAGATHVQGTANGYGERCGNANLYTIVAALELKLGCRCLPEGRLRGLMGLSQFVDGILNMPHDRKAPFVGESAFAHKAGMHVNAVQKNPRSFEHVPPERVGNSRRILISELSGGSNILLKAVEMGVALDRASPEVRRVLARLEQKERKGYEFEAADASFRLLIQKVLKKHRSFFELEGFRVIVEKRGKREPCVSEATVKLRVGRELAHTAGEGDGPVNALDSALRKALTRFYPEIAPVTLTDYHVRILDPETATAAKTRVLIESSDGESRWGTVGVSENIIEASWEALVDSVEYKLFMDEEKKRKAAAARPASEA
jgi:2-isopropylmalate synthase